ncbi:MAG TPA: calcium-binding protein [Chroococcales cyanobacterium]
MSTILGTASNDNLTGTRLRDVLYGLDGNDTLNGGDSKDKIFGNDGNDSLLGGQGNDIFYGGAGNDTLEGGSGSDIYIIDSRRDTIIEIAFANRDTVGSFISYTLDANLENLTLAGFRAINGTGNTLSNRIKGNSGNNILNGLDGNDILEGGAGIDTLIGGTGDDTYIVDSTSDTIVENFSAGTDTVQSSIKYTLGTNLEKLTLTGSGAINGTGNTLGNQITGNRGNNILNGLDGNDILEGGAGIDTLIGGTGNDTYIVDSTSDTIIENFSVGIDTVQSSISYTLGTNLENLLLTGLGANGTGNTLDNRITGDSNNNILNGLDGNDTLNGRRGMDTLIGGNGNDALAGGSGNDVLIGGNGDDRFLFDSGRAFTASAFGIDTIDDLSSGFDHIVLDKTSFTALTSLAGNGFSVASEFAVVGSDAAAATSSALIVYNSTNGNLFYNQNGAAGGFGTGAQFAVLSDSPLISASDFIIQV